MHVHLYIYIHDIYIHICVSLGALLLRRQLYPVAIRGLPRRPTRQRARPAIWLGLGLTLNPKPTES